MKFILLFVHYFLPIFFTEFLNMELIDLLKFNLILFLEYFLMIQNKRKIEISINKIFIYISIIIKIILYFICYIYSNHIIFLYDNNNLKI